MQTKDKKNAGEVVVKKSKRMKAAIANYDKEKSYSLEDAIKIVKDNALAKFDETIDVALRTGLDPRHADQVVRRVVSMPNGTGKKVRIAVFAKAEKAEEAKKAGADLVGAEDLAEKVLAGELNFDICYATPDMMGALGKLARILGPRGLMPNPKLGTVTTDLAKAINEAKSGRIEYRVDKQGNIHAGVGKASFTYAALVQNVAFIIDDINKAKPQAAKGTYLQALYLSSTMGPSVKVDIASILQKAAA